MNLYTLGFTQKTAQEFFELLRAHEVRQVMDIRLRPSGQLSAFARQEDLPYFLHNLVNGCGYVHQPLLAPTAEILKDYRVDKDWPRYVKHFEALLDERGVPGVLNRADFEIPVCLLCSEASAEQCHRHLVAARLAAHWPELNVIHL